MTTNQPTVETYQLLASNGRPIRKATKVVFSDGTEVKFTERMGKREAIKQAERLQARDAIATAMAVWNCLSLCAR